MNPWIKIFPPASIKRTLFFGFDVNLLAKTHPADPAPIIMKLNSSIDKKLYNLDFS